MEWSKIVTIAIDFSRACENHECMSVSSANILPFPIHESIFSADVTSPLPFPFPLLADHLSQVYARTRAYACMHPFTAWETFLWSRRCDCDKTIKCYCSGIPRQVCPSPLRSNPLERHRHFACMHYFSQAGRLCSIALKCQLRARVSPH